MKLYGIGASQREDVEDDVADQRLDTGLGLAVVSCGYVGRSHHGRAAAVLALWSLVGEVRAGGDGAFSRGLTRAQEAVARLTAGWTFREPPVAMLAAVQLIDQTIHLAHIGRCQVSRIIDGQLQPLTVPHDLSHQEGFAEVARTNPNAAQVGSLPTRAFGSGDSVPQRSSLQVHHGDELLLMSPQLLTLDASVVERLCQRERPSVTRALELRAHATATGRAFSFVLLRVVGDDAVAQVSGSSREPPLNVLYAPGAALPPLPQPLRGPDAAWDQLAQRLYAPSPTALESELQALARALPPSQQAAALLEGVRWTVQRLATRLGERVPPEFEALLRVLDVLHDAALSGQNLSVFDDAAAREWQTWSERNLSDWASDQGVERVMEALDGARYGPVSPDDFAALVGRLVEAEGLWDWDELAAEDAAVAGWRDEHLDALIKRGEQRELARVAMLEVLGSVRDSSP